MRGLLIACLLFFATSAAADFPALFDVYGVAEDDVLNARKEPSAQSDIVGALKPDTQSIEVIRLSKDGRWALVNFGEGTAWTATQFLKPSSKLTLIPPRMRCFGTEPFWDLHISWPTTSPSVDFSLAGDREQNFIVQQTDGLSGRSVIMSGPRETDDIHLLTAVKRQYCSDGMSDREFGLGVELFILNGGNWQNYTGCCSLAP
ncbi:MAG: SH3 domain-containing protein [Sulfitobacter sp.]